MPDSDHAIEAPVLVSAVTARDTASPHPECQAPNENSGFGMIVPHRQRAVDDRFQETMNQHVDTASVGN